MSSPTTTLRPMSTLSSQEIEKRTIYNGTDGVGFPKLENNNYLLDFGMACIKLYKKDGNILRELWSTDCLRKLNTNGYVFSDYGQLIRRHTISGRAGVFESLVSEIGPKKPLPLGEYRLVLEDNGNIVIYNEKMLQYLLLGLFHNGLNLRHKFFLNLKYRLRKIVIKN